MTPLLWMPTFIKQWLTSEKVGAMTIAQEGAFNRLLLLAWDHPACTIPADRDTLKRLAKWNGFTDADFESVYACFQPHPKLPGRLYNEFQMNLWGKAKHLQAVKSKAGRQGGVRRALNAGQALVKHRPTKNNTIKNNTVKEDKEKKATRTGVDDQVWMEALKADVAYQGIDIDRELGKAQRWCQERGRTCSRRFFVNWLNRAERPMQGRGAAPARSLVELGMRKK